ncbi:MAG: filamentous hemagglutinin N-terminal domain-containing protein [Candidatus Omnitrophica bacterium]|nr:filamentous hemagglutinin N-terminal domain-containing protein [Candidatus Omnitrophota bacterium]
MTFRIGAGLIVLMLFRPVFLYALPQGEQIIEGSATFDRSEANTLKININSDTAIIDYDSFDIGSNEIVYFTQPSTSSTALNRVTGLTSSDIAGFLSANGIIYLINPNGINIASTATINAASFIASTLNIQNSDFLAGKNIFEKNGSAAYILNQGNISAGGYVALLAQAVENKGVIIAGTGSVALAAGEKMTLSLDDLNQISVVIDEAVKSVVIDANGNRIDSAVKNGGTIIANGGKVILTAKILNDVFDYAVNNTGVIKATTIVERDGAIELAADSASAINTGSLEAGFVNIQVKTLIQGGLIAADKLITVHADEIISFMTGNPRAIEVDPLLNISPAVIMQAPEVRVFARQFGTNEAPLNLTASLTYLYRTSGNLDILDSLGIGTSILLRGPPDGFGAIVYDSNSSLNLEAPAGTITVAQGVLISAINLTLTANNSVNSNGSLIAGRLTLMSNGPITSFGILKADYLFESGASFGVGGVFAVKTANVQNSDNAITYESNTSVSGSIYDPDNIIISDDVTVTLAGDTTFTAGDSFIMNQGSSIEGGGYDLTIIVSGSSYFFAINNVGTFILDQPDYDPLDPLHTLQDLNYPFALYSPITVTNFTLTKGTVSLLGGDLTVDSGVFTIGSHGEFYETTDMAGNDDYEAVLANGAASSISGTFGDYSSGSAAYRVTTVADLQGISAADLSATYVQTGDIDNAGDFTAYIIGDSGMNRFEGIYNGNGYTISGLTIDTAANEAGFVGFLGGSGKIQNLGLLGVNITGGTANVGGLAGTNNGWIINCRVTGVISGGASSYLGGMAGNNMGVITHSYVHGSITGTSSLYVGGLAGYNAGTIESSYNTGTVTGISSAAIGGLVGFNSGPVRNSYTYASVSADAGDFGGFAGNDSWGSYSNNFWDSTVNPGLDDTGADGDIAGVTGLTTAELKTPSTFINSGWNINAMWDLVEGSYPEPGSGSVTLTTTQDVPAGTYDVLILNGKGAAFTAAGDITTTAFTISNGTFNANGYDISADNFDHQGLLQLTGDEDLSGLTKDTNSGSVEYTGADMILNYGNTYNNLTISGSATLSGDITASGDLIIGSGVELDASGHTLTVGSLVNNGTIISASDIHIISAGTISVGVIDCDGAVNLESTLGYIVDNNGDLLNISATGLTLSALYGIGYTGANPDALETQVSSINAATTGANAPIYIDEKDTLDSVTTTVNGSSQISINYESATPPPEPEAENETETETGAAAEPLVPLQQKQLASNLVKARVMPVPLMQAAEAGALNSTLVLPGMGTDISDAILLPPEAETAWVLMPDGMLAPDFMEIKVNKAF